MGRLVLVLVSGTVREILAVVPSIEHLQTQHSVLGAELFASETITGQEKGDMAIRSKDSSSVSP